MSTLPLHSAENALHISLPQQLSLNHLRDLLECYRSATPSTGAIVVEFPSQAGLDHNKIHTAQDHAELLRLWTDLTTWMASPSIPTVATLRGGTTVGMIANFALAHDVVITESDTQFHLPDPAVHNQVWFPGSARLFDVLGLGSLIQAFSAHHAQERGLIDTVISELDSLENTAQSLVNELLNAHRISFTETKAAQVARGTVRSHTLTSDIEAQQRLFDDHKEDHQ